MPLLGEVPEHVLCYLGILDEVIEQSLGEKFVKMYVSDLTIDMGEKGKQALELLFAKGSSKGLIPAVPAFDLL